ncbi:MAG TPA: HK97 family phage prohead protease [Gaiellales bacterium]|nr:HK97 family phage prohead protease [Gaiellales bacterium]
MNEITTVTFPALELRVPDDDERVVEGIVVPYGETSFLTPDPQGERFAPKSLNRTIRERPKVKLFLNHRHDDAVGTSVAWRVDDERGLWGKFKIPPGADGDRVLDKVRNELLDAFSIGFRPINTRRAPDGVREVLEAKLHEVSLVPIGAYDGARVLAVRSPARTAIAAMPIVNLDPMVPIRYWAR